MLRKTTTLKNVIKPAWNCIEDMLFPKFCFHCENALEKGRKFFCSSCVEFFTLVSKEGRCRGCFKEWEEGIYCEICRSTYWDGEMAAALEYRGPAQTLIKALKYQSQWYLAETAAAFLMLQLAALNWPQPDILVPVPQPLVKTLFRKYNHSSLLAQELAKYLKVPVIEPLKRYGGDFSQVNLSHEERIKFSKEQLKLKKCALQDKVILLIDDVLTTGTTIKSCAEVLYEGYPRKVYAITVCC